MSNRIRPKRQIPLHGNPSSATDRQRLPLALHHMEWTDEPAAQYSDRTLSWIADHRAEARRLNAWRCEACQLPFIAFDRHPGVTPMTTSHRAFAEALEETTDCQGVCVSVFYNPEGVRQAAADLAETLKVDDFFVLREVRTGVVHPTHEWYRPSFDELKRSSRPVRDHVMQGGLLLRKAGV